MNVDKKKLILIFDPISRAGGGLIYLLNAIPEFIQSELFSFSFYCNESIRPYLENKIPYCQVSYTSKLSSKGGIIAFLDRMITSGKIVKHIAPDMIIFMNQIPIKTKIPSLLFLRNALYYTTIDSGYMGPVDIFFKLYCLFFRINTHYNIKKCQAVVTSSKSFSKIISKYHNHEKNRIVAPFGINDILYNGEKKKFNRDQIKILFLQFNLYKGLNIAVEAITILLKRNYSIRLIITDNLNRYNNFMAKKILKNLQDHNLYDNVEMVGLKNQEELKKIYQDSDIFLFPSFVESFGHGLLEAMANGLPCVVSDLQVFRELAGSSVSYFKTGDSNDCANKISEIIEDVSYRNSLGTNGIEMAKKYSWKRHVSIIEESIIKMDCLCAE